VMNRARGPPGQGALLADKIRSLNKACRRCHVASAKLALQDNQHILEGVVLVLTASQSDSQNFNRHCVQTTHCIWPLLHLPNTCRCVLVSVMYDVAFLAAAPARKKPSISAPQYLGRALKPLTPMRAMPR